MTEYPVPTSAGLPEFIALGPDNALWFTEYSGNQIGRIDTTGAITEYPVPTSGSQPDGITAGPDGALWFTEQGANQIGRITPSGTFTEYPIPTSNSEPGGITVGPDGALWFTEVLGNQIGRITTSGAVTEYAIPTRNCEPVVITLGSDGALWFTEFAASQIGRVTATGAFTEYPTPTPSSAPDGIAQGPDGAVWFAEVYGNNIGRITTSGAINEYPVPTLNSNPAGITLGGDGALWFTEYSGGKLGRSTISGVITEYPILTAGNQPSGITNGPDDAVWFTENGQSNGSGGKIGRMPLTSTTACTLIASPAQLTFTAVIGGPGDQQSISLMQSPGCGPNPIGVSVGDTQNSQWLYVLNTSFPLVLEANPNGLQPNTYQDTLVFTSSAASNSPLYVPVTFVVTSTQTTYQPLPDALLSEPYNAAIGPYFCSQAGGALPPGLSVSGTGGCTVSGIPASAGTYQFLISYLGQQAGYQITVVTQPSSPSFTVTPTVSATTSDNSPLIVTKTVTLTNTGSSGASFGSSIQGEANANFSISPTSGFVNAGSSVPITVTFNSTGQLVAPGYYLATYTIVDTTTIIQSQTPAPMLRHMGNLRRGSLKGIWPRSSGSSTTSNSGTFQVTNNAVPQASVTSLLFTMPEGSQQTEPFTIVDAGGFSVNVTASYAGAGSAAGAVSVGNGSGATPITMTATARTSGLVTGQNIGAVTISCVSVPCQPPLNIPVDITVQSPTQTGSGPHVMSHLANGGGWTTTILLVNAGSQTASYTLNSYGDNGSALSLPLAGGGNTSSLQGPLAPGQLGVIETDGSGSLTEGWAELVSTGAIGGTGIFTASPPMGAPPSEAAVPLDSAGGTTVYIPYDNTRGQYIYSSSFALANPNSTAANVIVTFTNQAGNAIPVQKSQITIPANGHYASVLGIDYPEVNGQRGIMQFKSNVAIDGLGIRYNGSAFTSIGAIIP